MANETLPLVSRNSDTSLRAGTQGSLSPNSGKSMNLNGAFTRPAVLTIDDSTTDDDEQGLLSPVDGDGTAHSLEEGLGKSTALFRWEGTDDEQDEDGWEISDHEDGERASGEWTGRITVEPALLSGMRGGERRSSHTLTKGQKRRLYGGGLHGENSDGGQLGVTEVAGLILGATLGPTPLLMAHAAALLGLPLFLPLLFLIAILSAFAYIVIGVEGRYVGARSWPALASAVFPHRFGLHKAGEVFTSLVVIFCALGRGVNGILMSAEIIVDLFFAISGSARPSWSVQAAIAALAALWIVAPVLLYPFNRSFTFRRHSTTAASRLGSTMALVLYPIALLILGVRLQTLNLPSSSLKTPNLFARDDSIPSSAPEVMGYSIWGGISIIVFSLSSHSSAFKFLSSLARPSATARGTTRNSSISRMPVENSPPPTAASGNDWPLAAMLGVFISMLIHLGWGLVGYLGIPGGGTQGNVFTHPILALVQADGSVDDALITVRLMVLVIILMGLEGTLETAKERVATAISILVGSVDRESSPRPGHRRNESGYARMREGEDRERQKERGSWDWKGILARWLVLGLVGGLAILFAGMGDTGEGAINVAEVVGAVGNSLMGFLFPSLFFIILFHLRRARSIFLADPSSPAFCSDTLLLRKELAMQRKLSGRRIWQDVAVFGGLLPFGTVLLLRGAIALARKEY